MDELSPAWATSILKTWSNTWTTSTRMHENDALPCLFGCTMDDRDALDHYLSCLNLWAGIFLAGRGYVPPIRWSFFFEDVWKRLLLVQPSIPAALDLVTAFLAYHAVKHENRREVLRMIGDRDAEALRARIQCIVRVAREQALNSASRSSATAIRSETTPATR